MDNDTFDFATASSDEIEVHLGQVAYHAYGEVVEFKNYQGLPMPSWDELSDKIRAAWVAASRAATSWALDHLEASDVPVDEDFEDYPDEEEVGDMYGDDSDDGDIPF